MTTVSWSRTARELTLIVSAPSPEWKSSVKNDLSKLTGLAVVSKVLPTLGPGPALAEVRVKYTWVGDADGDGAVTGDDYYRIDRGFMARKTDYQDGDFDFSGVIDLDDYAVIDAGYLGQTGVL